MTEQSEDTISLRKLQAMKQGETDVVPMPKPRIAPGANRTANLVQIGPAGPGLGRRFTITQESVSIGRESDCSLYLADGSVSRLHAQIDPRPDGSFRLTDLNSRNGTFVNGARIARAVLKDGDYVQMGDCVFRFLAGGNVEAGYHDEVHRLTLLDPLTGVHNRRSLGEFLDRELERAHTELAPLAVLLIDADHFKQINDRHRHAGGDAVLRGLADRLRRVARANDLVARYGGEEFAVVMPGTDLASAVLGAERIRAAVNLAPFEFNGIPIPLTVSIGVAAIASGEDRTGAGLLQATDERLYEAKAAGRNCVRPAPPALANLSALINTPGPVGATREVRL
jgi:diguanylate cyclase (GGDEF)-like protein